jgi:hypothetical protein
MDEATDIAEALRRDLRSAQKRLAVVSLEEPCAKCGRQLGQQPPNSLGLPAGGAVPPLYVFPSGLAFHGLCCAAEVVALVSPQQAGKIRGLLEALSKLPAPGVGLAGAGSGGGGHGSGDVAGAGSGAGAGGAALPLLAQLEEQVASECPWNGEVTVRLIDLPFVSPEADRKELQAWAL